MINLLEEYQYFHDFCLNKSKVSIDTTDYQKNIDIIKNNFIALCSFFIKDLPVYHGSIEMIKAKERIFLYSKLQNTPCEILNQFSSSCIFVNHQILEKK